jgi:hypothetical protein
MREPKPQDDYNRPMTGEHALMLPPYHAVRRQPFRTSGFLRMVR